VRRARLTLALVLALVACGGDDEAGQDVTLGVAPGEDPISCVELFDGQSFETADDLSTICLDENGNPTLNAAATTNCADERVLWWNDVAWGYLGEPATLHEEGAELVAPQAERDACGG
jgi:hypothetical protein